MPKRITYLPHSSSYKYRSGFGKRTEICSVPVLGHDCARESVWQFKRLANNHLELTDFRLVKGV